MPPRSLLLCGGGPRRPVRCQNLSPRPPACPSARPQSRRWPWCCRYPCRLSTSTRAPSAMAACAAPMPASTAATASLRCMAGSRRRLPVPRRTLAARSWGWSGRSDCTPTSSTQHAGSKLACQHVDGCAAVQKVEHHLRRHLGRIGTHAFRRHAVVGRAQTITWRGVNAGRSWPVMPASCILKRLDAAQRTGGLREVGLALACRLHGAGRQVRRRSRWWRAEVHRPLVTVPWLPSTTDNSLHCCQPAVAQIVNDRDLQGTGSHHSRIERRTLGLDNSRGGRQGRRPAAVRLHAGQYHLAPPSALARPAGVRRCDHGRHGRFRLHRASLSRR